LHRQGIAHNSTGLHQQTLPHARMMLLATTLLSLLGAVNAAGHGKHMAVVRTFSTSEEVDLLMESGLKWEMMSPCLNASNDSMVDLILVYSKDLAMDSHANSTVMALEDAFNTGMYNWSHCFSGIRNFSAKLSPEEDMYDDQGYVSNKHWVKGPNTVFKSILEAFFYGEYMGEYSNFFLMEMDAVPIMSGWLDVYMSEAMDMSAMGSAVRGSQYLGDKWDLFKHVMPEYLVQHINGNAIYNLENNWTKYLYDTFTSDAQMVEKMAFDVAFAKISMEAMKGENVDYAAAWMAAGGGNDTYNTHTSLIGNYANTLLNTSFEFGTYIRHGSEKNLFYNLPDDNITLGVAGFTGQNHHLMSTIPTTHPFKKITFFAFYDVEETVENISAPGGDVMVETKMADDEPYKHLCVVARNVDTKWFALTDNFHIVNAPVSVLMSRDDPDTPVLPYVRAESRYCGERPNCKASLMQADELFGISLNYHHEQYEVLYRTEWARDFCTDWETAAAGKTWADCSMAFGPTADDYMAWMISEHWKDWNISYIPKDKTRYGWRTWTSLWTPAPVDERNCSEPFYGEKEYQETLGNISLCSLNVENATACEDDRLCMWRPIFETGVCLLDPAMTTTSTTTTTTTSTTAAAKEDSFALTLTAVLTVADPTEITENVTYVTAMRKGMADLMGVDMADVQVTFSISRRLQERKLQTTLTAIFVVLFQDQATATTKTAQVEAFTATDYTQEFLDELTVAGYTGSVEVTSTAVTISFTTTTAEVTTTTTTVTLDDGTSSTVVATLLLAAFAAGN